MKKFLLAILLIPLGLTCSEHIQPMPPPVKVVSLSPTVTQLILYLDGADRLCGRSSACYFPEVSHLPVVGDMGRPFPEAILQSRAGLIISDARHPGANWRIFRRCGVQVEFPDTGNIDSLPANLRKLGKLLQLPGAEKKADEVAGKLAQLRGQDNGERIKGVILFGTAPLITCGKDSFISGAMELAGVENIAADAGNGYFILSPEFLHRENPGVIIIVGVPENIVRHDLRSGLLASLPAVRQDRVIFVDGDRWSKLTPEIIDAAADLRRQLW